MFGESAAAKRGRDGMPPFGRQLPLFASRVSASDLRARCPKRTQISDRRPRRFHLRFNVSRPGVRMEILRPDPPGDDDDLGSAPSSFDVPPRGLSVIVWREHLRRLHDAT